MSEGVSDARRPPRPMWVVASAAALGVLVLAGIGAASFWIGSASEKACVDGQAPADNQQGGSACFRDGSELPPGWMWDPRGNYEVD